MRWCVALHLIAVEGVFCKAFIYIEINAQRGQKRSLIKVGVHEYALVVAIPSYHETMVCGGFLAKK